MSDFPYRLTVAIGTRGTLGLIVLQVDETIEQDFRRLLPAQDLALYVSRIPSGADLTEDSIAQMERDLPAAAALLPQAPEFDVAGYACTSGTALIGAARVAELVRGACRARSVSTPLTAAGTALRHLGLRRLGIVSPYAAEIADGLRDAFEAMGFAVPRALSFGERTEANVARIDPVSIREAAREIARAGDIDGVFLSCTNLRTLDVIAPLEDELGLPVLSSNLVMAWDMARAAGATDLLRGGGRLLAGRG
ncbi:MAG: aspartate/glutamate racemase family protein [Defluviimonas sp.]|uniref:maleate cis-trans isomerase family protein n=1 Tax=Albidovulum sp. TaxID=1872424 RepID=UPI002A351D32|nr:aspartate/glutamate racemase family protein [Defluviimonas sp.]